MTSFIMTTVPNIEFCILDNIAEILKQRSTGEQPIVNHLPNIVNHLPSDSQEACVQSTFFLHSCPRVWAWTKWWGLTAELM